LSAGARCGTASAIRKPVTYNETFDVIVFKERYMLSPHSWAIEKAIELLERMLSGGSGVGQEVPPPNV